VLSNIITNPAYHLSFFQVFSHLLFHCWVVQ
jgi:hypothetical protein